MRLYGMTKDSKGSFSSKHCHDNYLYYVQSKNGMVSLDMGGGHNFLYSSNLEECLMNIVCLGAIGLAAYIGAYYGMLICKHRYIP